MDPRPPTRSAGPIGLLILCVLFYAVNNGIWLLIDRSSPSFDRAAHASFALHYLRLFEAPTRLSMTKLLTVTQYWPPFFHLCSVPFTMALGFSVSSVAATNFLFLPVAVFSIYRIGRRLFDEWVGVGAVVLTLLYPMVYALSRAVLVDFALIAMVALSLDLVLASDAGLNRRRGWLLGGVFGCAMLTKWTAVTFLLGPTILWLALSFRRDRPPLRAVVVALGTVTLMFAIVALPWYVTAFEAFLRTARVAFGSDPAQEGDPVRIIDSLRWYWGAVQSALILKLLLIPTLVGAGAVVVRRRSWPAVAFLLCWIVPAVVFFVLIPNKDGRFIAPALPAVAIMATAGLRSLPWKALRTASWVFIVTAGLYQFYAISFAWPVKIDHFYTGPPRREDWRVNDILTAITTLDGAGPIGIAVLPNESDFEPNIFRLAAEARELPVRIEGVGHALEPISAWKRYDVIVSKTGSLSVEYATAFRSRLRDDLSAWMASTNRDPHITLWRTWPLPDGSLAQVYLVR
jgi:4-amino-4-deoxy-L-arabinose transferase-like glycosyltransferase